MLMFLQWHNHKRSGVRFDHRCVEHWLGAVTKDNKTGGGWTPVKSKLNINASELKAVQFGQKSLCKSKSNVHIRLRIDNVTVLIYVNNMGGTKSRMSNLIANEIWTWSIDRNIWLSAGHLPGSKNVLADEQSRVFDDTTQWMINKCVFLELIKIFGSLAIDLFAWQLNKQVATVISWKLDPDALFIDAFSRTWNELNLYTERIACILCMHLGACRFSTYPTALMHLKK